MKAGVGEGTEGVRERILTAFSSRAKRFGMRGVLMGELASDLHMSASTLYKHFPSKQDLALASVERWASELGAAEAATTESVKAGFERFMHWANAWADAMASLSPAFIEDLKREYPAAYERFQEETRERQRWGASLLRPALKKDIDQRVALDVLNVIMSRVTRPEYAERFRISRHEAIRSAVSVWAAGALQREGKVRRLRRKD